MGQFNLGGMDVAVHTGNSKKSAVIFLAPSLIGFSTFFFVPFIMAVLYSFIDNPVSGNFVGFNNYIQMLGNQAFLSACKNTLVFTATSVPLNIAMSLAMALLLNKNIYVRSILRTTFIMPLIAPTASVVLIWQVVFNFHGSLNSVITFAGAQPVDWMNSQWTRLVVVAFYLWKNIGYNMILFLAALQNIPREYYEAAMLDGAGAVRRFINITAVFLVPTAFFVLIISIINSFKVFREIYLISGNYPYESIYMLQHYMNNMFMSLDYQKLSTAAVMMALVIILIVFVLFRIEEKIDQYI